MPNKIQMSPSDLKKGELYWCDHCRDVVFNMFGTGVCPRCEFPLKPANILEDGKPKKGVAPKSNEPDGRKHKLTLGQRTGHVAVLASMEPKKAGSVISEDGPGATTSWADGIQRDSTELGATSPVAKGEVAALAGIQRGFSKSRRGDMWGRGTSKAGLEYEKFAKEQDAIEKKRKHAVACKELDKYAAQLRKQQKQNMKPSVESQAKSLVKQVLSKVRQEGAEEVRDIYADMGSPKSMQWKAWEFCQTWPEEILSGLLGGSDGNCDPGQCQNIDSMLDQVEDLGEFTREEWKKFFERVREEGI